MRALLAEVEQQLASSHALDAESRNDARRESRLLVASILQCAPGDVARALAADADAYAYADAATATSNSPHTRLHDHVVHRIRAAAARRANGEPLAYAVSSAAFRYLELYVDSRVLIPRPETEIVVDQVLALCAKRPGGVAVDIGTGSGAIALALATEGHFDRVIATDISADALVVAARNAEAVQAPIPVEFRHGADLAPLVGVLARVIVSNPPYIAYDEATNLPNGVRNWEPATALFAPEGGMARYNVLLAQAAEFLEPDGVLVLEVDARRASDTAVLARRFGWEAVRLVKDLSGRDRVLVARNPARAAFVASITAGHTETTTDA